MTGQSSPRVCSYRDFEMGDSTAFCPNLGAAIPGAKQPGGRGGRRMAPAGPPPGAPPPDLPVEARSKAAAAPTRVKRHEPLEPPYVFCGARGTKR